MDKIKQRAKELSVIDDDGWCVRDLNIEKACITIANEVIDKACEWIENYDNEQLPYTDLDCDGRCYVDMRKFAEEFRKAMKVE